MGWTNEYRFTPDNKGIESNIILSSLKLHAHEIAIRFLCPVYLVGSFLDDPEKALDIDIIIPMTEDRWMRLFGDKHFNEHQLKWRRKQKEWFEKSILWDFDVRPQLVETFFQHDKYRLRLDSLSDEMLLPEYDIFFKEEES